MSAVMARRAESPADLAHAMRVARAASCRKRKPPPDWHLNVCAPYASMDHKYRDRSAAVGRAFAPFAIGGLGNLHPVATAVVEGIGSVAADSSEWAGTDFVPYWIRRFSIIAQVVAGRGVAHMASRIADAENRPGAMWAYREAIRRGFAVDSFARFCYSGAAAACMPAWADAGPEATPVDPADLEDAAGEV